MGEFHYAKLVDIEHKAGNVTVFASRVDDSKPVVVKRLDDGTWQCECMYGKRAIRTFKSSGFLVNDSACINKAIRWGTMSNIILSKRLKKLAEVC